MRIFIHQNALKHGLTKEQIKTAFSNAFNGFTVRERDKKSDPTRWATIGFDTQARLIELVFIRLDDASVLIFHANYLTKGFKTELDKQKFRS